MTMLRVIGQACGFLEEIRLFLFLKVGLPDATNSLPVKKPLLFPLTCSMNCLSAEIIDCESWIPLCNL